MAENLKTAQQINKLLKERKQLIAANTRELAGQVGIQKALCDAMKCDTGSLDDMTDSVETTTKAMLAASKGAQQFGKQSKSAGEEGGGSFDVVKAAAGGASKAIKGVWGAVMVGVGAVMGALGKVVGLYGSFMKQAADVADQMLVGAEAAEQLRDKFGDLSSGVGGEIRNRVRDFGDAFSEAGVSMGFGFKAGAELMNVVGALYKEMDPSHMGTFLQFTGEAQVQMGVLGMAMGLTGKETAAMAQRFKSLGQDAPMEMAKIKGMAAKLEKAIGIDAKAIGKSFAEMQGNVKNFGDMSVEAMGSAIAKAGQLGLGVKELAAVSDAFFNFDKAADNVSKLSQAFGVNIDTMAMMNAENPADQMDMLRDSMFAAGKSAETMSRHEKALLGSTLGLSASQAELMFSQEAQYMSQEELDKAMADDDPQQQMVNAMKDVGKEIKSVVVSLQEMGLAGKGFFGSFAKGISDGLFKFGPFAEVSERVSGIMKELYTLGRNFADMLMGVGKKGDELTPVAQAFEGIHDVLDKIVPAFEWLSGPDGPLVKVVSSFMAFFKEADPEKSAAAFEDMIKNIKASFKGMIERIFGEGGGDEMKVAFKTMMDKAIPFITGLLGTALPYVLKGIGILIAGITSGLWQALKTRAGQNLATFVWAVANIWKGIKNLLKKLALKFWTFIRSLFGATASGAEGGGLMSGLMTKFPKLASIMSKVAVPFKFFGTVLGKVNAAFVLIISAIKPVIGLIDDFKKIYEGMATGKIGFFEGLWKQIVAFFGRLLQWAVGVADNLTFGLFDFLDPDRFHAMWDTFVYELGDMFKSMWEGIKSFFIGIGEKLVALFDWSKKIAEAGGRLVGALLKGLQKKWVGVKKWFAKIPGWIMAYLNFVKDIYIAGGKLIWGFLKAIKEKWVAVVMFFVDAGVAIYKKVTGFSSKLKEGAINMLTGFLDGVKEKWTAVVRFVELWGGVLFKAVRGIGPKLREGAINILTGFLDGLKEKWEDIKGYFADKLGGLLDMLPFSPAKEGPLAGDKLKKGGEGIFSSIWSGLKEGAARFSPSNLISGALTAVKERAASALEGMGEMMSAGAERATAFITSAREGFMGTLRTLAADALEISGILSPALEALQELSRQLDATFTGFAEVFAKVSDMFAAGGSANVDVMTDRIAQAGASIVEMSKVLGSIDSVELKTKVEEILGTSLFSGADSKDAGQAQINIHVNLDAKKFALAMVSTGIIPKV